MVESASRIGLTTDLPPHTASHRFTPLPSPSPLPYTPLSRLLAPLVFSKRFMARIPDFLLLRFTPAFRVDLRNSVELRSAAGLAARRFRFSSSLRRILGRIPAPRTGILLPRRSPQPRRAPQRGRWPHGVPASPPHLNPVNPFYVMTILPSYLPIL